jgi:DNA-directed RNA polymerase specialized sigma subunit
LNYFIENNEAVGSPQPQGRQDSLEYIFNLLSQLKDKRIEKVFELRYLGDDGKESWSRIGENMSVSTQTAINLHDRGLKVLRKKMGSEVFFDKV